MRRFQCKKRVGYANFIVLIARVFMRAIFCTEYRMDKFLGGGFAHTARHADKRNIKQLAM
ncbi:hypothetical protein SDC9_161342 [bioreactor metagenome]|uniref:Uncharacterized protein n=1 Tax=bioreactor metagenome TaxID=1076179 RepID=A0A645FK27_9ZZZZ